MIVCNNLKYIYVRSAEGLDCFTFNDITLPEGVCGLLGKNGVGKSTLIKIIAGTLFPKSGECIVHGYDTQKRDVKMLQDIAIIPEECDVPNISAIEYKKRWAPAHPNFDFNLFDTLLKNFDITTSKKIGTMSFGQKKKFLISAAIATRAKLLLLDEPTDGLDISGRMLFKQFVSKYIFKGQRIIISTHQVKDIEGIITSLVIMNDGKLLLSTSIENIQKTFSIEKKKRVPRSNTKDMIFGMPDVEGYTILKKNTKRTIKNKMKVVDLELFFSAAINETTKVIEACNGTKIGGDKYGR